MKKTVTIHDVSERAGVSLSTVSRVLNDTTPVRPALRDRVLRAVDELGYTPNLAARTLKTNRSHSIVFMVPEISNPYFTETYRGIRSVAAERGYVSFLYEADDVEKVLQTIITRGADGVVLDAIYREASKEALVSAGIPFVQTNTPVDHADERHCIRINLYGATLSMIDYLHSMGHRRIGLITYMQKGFPLRERLRAFRAYAAGNGLRHPERYIAETVGVDKFAGGFQGIQTLLSRNPDITAVICMNDLVALGAIAGAESAGKHVPADISIVGFDNTSIAQYTNPPLTTTNIPTIRQGEIAARMLFELMEHPSADPYSVEIHTEIVVRDSVRRLDADVQSPESLKTLSS
ncbi:LacI family DNA-binding transcriptional regulator [Salinispira pacifica]